MKIEKTKMQEFLLKQINRLILREKILSADRESLSSGKMKRKNTMFFAVVCFGSPLPTPCYRIQEQTPPIQ